MWGDINKARVGNLKSNQERYDAKHIAEMKLIIGWNRAKERNTELEDQNEKYFLKAIGKSSGTSLEIQRLKLCLSMQRVQVWSLVRELRSYLESVCSMSSSNCYFLTFIQISQEAGQVVWYSHLLKNFPQFIVIHTVKGFGIVNKAEIDVFLELSCFFNDPSAAAAAKSLQSCLTLWDPIDSSLPGSPIPGILQARTLKWVAISFSNA